MIRIADERFKKQGLTGALSLDRAVVPVFGIDLRKGRGGSPGIRCDIVWGIEKTGRFLPYDYDSLESTHPHYVEAHAVPAARDHARRTFVARGSDPLQAMALWLEQYLVDSGVFGDAAEVVEEQ